jgi:uncharacterized LabA/DUF88 family protein
MKRAILLIDGENFLFKVKQVLQHEQIDKHSFNLPNIQLTKLISKVFSEYKDLKIKEQRYYSAKLSVNEDSKVKSLQLIRSQRNLKTNLEKQGFTFILSGNVRAQKVLLNGKSKTIFKEKGVDVKIAVDMVSIACDKLFDTIILCSSDSDLQPAIHEVKRRNIEVIYLGFEMIPNKGLTYTSNKTVLFRSPEILNSLPHTSK